MKKLVLTVFIKNKEYAKALMRGLSMESPGIEVKEAHSLREAQVCSLYGILITDREAYGTFAVRIERQRRLTVREMLSKSSELYFEGTGILFGMGEGALCKLMDFGSHYDASLVGSNS